MNRKCGTSRKRKFSNLSNFQFLENAKVTSIVCKEAQEKVGKGVNLKIRKVITRRIKCSGQSEKLKARDIDSCVTPG